MIDKEAVKIAASNACSSFMKTVMEDSPMEDAIERLFIYADTIIEKTNDLVRIENEKRASSMKAHEEFGSIWPRMPLRKYPYRSHVIGAKVRGIVVDGEFYPADDHGTVTITL